MKVPLENTQIDVVIIKLQNNEENEEFEPHDFGPFVDPNFPLPNEIMIKIYSYLNILDLLKCAKVSKRMRSLCFHHSLEFIRKFSMVKINSEKVKARKLRLGLILHAHQCRKGKVSKDMLKML